MLNVENLEQCKILGHPLVDDLKRESLGGVLYDDLKRESLGGLVKKEKRVLESNEIRVVLFFLHYRLRRSTQHQPFFLPFL